MQIDQLINLLNNELEPWRFSDHVPNGLQIEGKQEVHKIIAGVSASQSLIDEAIKQKADAILVHHGYFWKNENVTITGIKKKRIQTLLANEISLIAYHSPLDAHLILGNNAQLANLFSWNVKKQGSEKNMLWLGNLSEAISANNFTQQISKKLARTAQLIGDKSRIIRNIAWCSGGGQSLFTEAIKLGVDAFICGEISEPSFHLANESGCVFIAAGHHATERYGIQALAKWLNGRENLQTHYIELDNPI